VGLFSFHSPGHFDSFGAGSAVPVFFNHLPEPGLVDMDWFASLVISLCNGDLRKISRTPIVFADTPNQLI